MRRHNQHVVYHSIPPKLQRFRDESLPASNGWEAVARAAALPASQRRSRPWGDDATC